RRDQSHRSEDPVRAARSDGRASGDDRSPELSPARQISGHRDPEPARVRRHLSVAGVAARPLHAAHRSCLPRARARAGDPREVWQRGRARGSTRAGGCEHCFGGSPGRGRERARCAGAERLRRRYRGSIAPARACRSGIVNARCARIAACCAHRRRHARRRVRDARRRQGSCAARDSASARARTGSCARGSCGADDHATAARPNAGTPLVEVMSLRQNALALAVITVLMAIIGDWSGDPDLARWCHLPLALLLLGLAYDGWIMLRAGLGVAITSAKPGAILGRPAALEMTFTHRLRRLLTLQIAADSPPSVEMDGAVKTLVVPPAGASLPFTATPRRLGQQTWPPLRARVAGPLGLAWWTRPLPAQFTLSVAPDLLRDDAERAGGTASGARARSLLGAGGEVLQLREYRPGDPQHVIDWKATARSNRLVSRDFSEDQHLEIILAIDAGRASSL